MAERAQHEGPAPDLFSLTQIRHLMRVEFSRAQRYGYPLSCLVVSMDGLERLRDEHGYEVVETTLGEITDLLESETRVCDFLGRLSYDQLVAVLPHTGEEGARTSADRLVSRARACGAEHGLTISVGGANFHDENTLFFDALLETAEEAARRAVEQGGDRVVFLDPGVTDTGEESS
jgi:diguanylate cyclase (GGDEF)-like protein